MSRFNLERWNLGRSIEDKILPDLNTFFDANLERSDDVFDIFDFKDEEKNDCDFNMKLTGTNHIPHYLIPVNRLTEFNVDN